MLPKFLIRSADGMGTIPDGYAIDFATKRWFLVEAELSSHSVWGHIAPQVSKQLVAALQPASRSLIVDTVVERIREDAELRTHIDELGVPKIDIRWVLTEIITSSPIVGIPIDHVSTYLREWAQTLRCEVKLWIVRKLVDFDDPTNVPYEIPDEYRPVFDTSAVLESLEVNVSYDISLTDLVEAGMLSAGEKLTMVYGPRGGTRETYIAEVTSDGKLIADNRQFLSPSYAAVHFIQAAGSPRKTANGWSRWRTSDGRTLADLRDAYLKSYP